MLEEGIRLYKSEMASWHGTDLFLAKYKERENIGGYISYLDNGLPKCVFYSKAINTKVIGTISFDTSFNPQTALVDLSERNFTDLEKEIIALRENTNKIIESDSFFKRYSNTQFNLVPLIGYKEKKVYVFTATKRDDVVIFGNDYLLLFDENSKLISRKRLHDEILPAQASHSHSGKGKYGPIHFHKEGYNEFITATDVCTIMLYKKFTNWKQFNFLSKNYVSVWNCENNELSVFSLQEKSNNHLFI